MSSRHDLDRTIDEVAARMVAAPEDASLLSRTIAQLPERQVTPWFLAWPAHLAAGAALVLVAFLWAPPDEPTVVLPAPLAAAAPQPVAKPMAVMASPVAVAAGVDARPRPPVVVLERPDHERSLAPVDAIEALELSGIAPSAIELGGAPILAPLALPELALDTKGES